MEASFVDSVKKYCKENRILVASEGSLFVNYNVLLINGKMVGKCFLKRCKDICVTIDSTCELYEIQDDLYMQLKDALYVRIKDEFIEVLREGRLNVITKFSCKTKKINTFRRMLLGPLNVCATVLMKIEGYDISDEDFSHLMK